MGEEAVEERVGVHFFFGLEGADHVGVGFAFGALPEGLPTGSVEGASVLHRHGELVVGFGFVPARDVHSVVELRGSSVGLVVDSVREAGHKGSLPLVAVEVGPLHLLFEGDLGLGVVGADGDAWHGERLGSGWFFWVSVGSSCQTESMFSKLKIN